MATSTTIRVREHTRRALADLASREGRTIPDVVEQLVENAEASAMFATHRDALARVDADPRARADLDDELRQLEQTLADGLKGDEWPLDADGQPAR